MVMLFSACKNPESQTDRAGETRAVCVAVGVDRGALGDGELGKLLTRAIGSAADDMRIDVWEVTAAGSSPRNLGLDRDVVAARRNRQDQIGELVAAILRKVGHDPNGGRALFETLTTMGEKVTTMTGCTERLAVLVTGGGEQRTAKFDVRDVDGAKTPLDERTASDWAKRIQTVVMPKDVTARVWGVGDFTDVDPPVDDEYRRALLTLWKGDVCPCVIEAS